MTLQEQFGLRPSWVAADIGSGTGKLSRLLLSCGCTVFGVEPSPQMRAEAEEELAHFDGRFHSIAGSAEMTNLPDQSVDLIAAGQAAHWFDVQPAAVEFRRILRPGGWVALVWNSRDEHDGATIGFSQLLKKHPGRTAPPRRANAMEHDRKVLLGRAHYAFAFIQEQQADLETLLSLALSKSYAPLPGDQEHEPLVEAVEALFERYQQDDRLRLVYRTELFVGRP